MSSIQIEQDHTPKGYSNTHILSIPKKKNYKIDNNTYTLAHSILTEGEFTDIFKQRSEEAIAVWAKKLYKHIWGLDLRTFKIRWFEEGQLNPHIQYPIKQKQTIEVMDINLYERTGSRFVGDIKEFRVTEKLMNIYMNYPRMLESSLIYFLALKMFKSITGVVHGYLDKEVLLEIIRTDALTPFIFNTALSNAEDLLQGNLQPNELKQIVLNGENSLRPFKDESFKDFDIDTVHKQAISKPTSENLQLYINVLAQKYWGKSLSIPVFVVSSQEIEDNAASFNIALISGYICFSINSEYILFAKQNARLFEELLLHEISHCMCFYNNGFFGFDDGDEIFESELKRIGALSNFEDIKVIAERLNLPYDEDFDLIRYEANSFFFALGKSRLKLFFEKNKEFRNAHLLGEKKKWAKFA